MTVSSNHQQNVSAIRVGLVALPLFVTILGTGRGLASEDEHQPPRGVNAVVLKPPWSASPALEDLLADEQHSVSLKHFYRDGGQHIPATPTECRISYNRQELLVFRCTEKNMSFPAAPMVANNATLAGWEADAAGNRLIIRLPSGKLCITCQPEQSTWNFEHRTLTYETP